MFANQQKGAAFVRFNRQVPTTADTFADCPVGDFAGVSVGPRHTCGAVLLQNRSFDCLKLPLPTVSGASTFAEPVQLVGPRAPYVGAMTGRTTVLMPKFDSSTYGQYITPEVDLLFWKELPVIEPKRADFLGVLTLATGTDCFFPIAGRRSTSIRIVKNAGTCATTIQVGYYHFQQFELEATMRSLGSGVVVPAEGWVATIGEIAGAPATPLAGENAYRPGGLRIAEAGAGANITIVVEAID